MFKLLLIPMGWVILAAAQFVLVHGPDNQEINLNVNEISSIREPREGKEEHFAKGTHCIVIMTNGKFITTQEDCHTIIKMIQDHDNSGGQP